MIDTVLALTLIAVLDRASQYVAQFQRDLSNVVAEESYRQDWTTLPRAAMRPLGFPGR